MSNPSEEEINIASEIISRVESPMPTVLFTEIARLVSTPLIELLPFSIIKDELQIRMIPRPEDDVVWKGQIHVPGNAFRGGENIEPVLQRLFQGELAQKALAGTIGYLGINFHDSERGTEQAHICYFLEKKTNELRVGKLYPVDNLPNKVVPSQLPMIYRAADEVIKSHGLRPLDPALPRAEIYTFEQHLARLLASLTTI